VSQCNMPLFPPPKFIHSWGDSCRAKEAVAAKAKAEQTAMARAQECEEKERLAEETCAQHKVSCILAALACFVIPQRSA